MIFYGGTGQFKLMAEIGAAWVSAILDDQLPQKEIIYRGQTIPIFPGSELQHVIELFKPTYFCVAVGNPHSKFRIEKSEELSKVLQPIDIIHRTASISDSAKFGRGFQVSRHVCIGPETFFGDWCILNSNCNVEHDCVLEDGAELGPSATLCGNVHVGRGSWIGAGAVVRQHIVIGENSIVGCGSVVVKDVPSNTVVCGNPAKFLRQN
jgi:sugar O-acyltransferase (sialic acid O-acetyltransferase NeuD family)